MGKWRYKKRSKLFHRRDLLDIIYNLKHINLKTCNPSKIKKEINCCCCLPYMITSYNSPKTIDRAVDHIQVDSKFHAESEISYLPKEKNKTYRRASTPNNTMFYGGLIPENIYKEELNPFCS